MLPENDGRRLRQPDDSHQRNSRQPRGRSDDEQHSRDRRVSEDVQRRHGDDHQRTRRPRGDDEDRYPRVNQLDVHDDEHPPRSSRRPSAVDATEDNDGHGRHGDTHHHRRDGGHHHHGHERSNRADERHRHRDERRPLDEERQRHRDERPKHRRESDTGSVSPRREGMRKKPSSKRRPPAPKEQHKIFYIDFNGSISTTFSKLLGTVNEYLANNVQVKPKLCEVFDTKASAELRAARPTPELDGGLSSHHECGNTKMDHYTTIRLWTEPKLPEDPQEAQTIGCMTAVPDCTYHGSKYYSPRFKKFSEAIDDFNSQLEVNPIPGRVLNVDIHTLKFHRLVGNLNPDQAVFDEKVKRTHFLTVIRVFYITGPTQYETIGFQEFLPRCVTEGLGIFAAPRYESFQVINERAHQWIKKQTEHRIVNVKTGRYQFKTNKRTQRNLATQSTIVCRILGTASWFLKYLIVFHTSCPFANPKPVKGLYYRTFHPALLSMPGIACWATFESQADHFKRVEAYLNFTRAKVFTVETVSVRLKRRTRCFADPEEAIECINGPMGKRVLAIRVYFEKEYQEPPPDAMPRYPLLVEKTGCTIL